MPDNCACHAYEWPPQFPSKTTACIKRGRFLPAPMATNGGNQPDCVVFADGYPPKPAGRPAITPPPASVDVPPRAKSQPGRGNLARSPSGDRARLSVNTETRLHRKTIRCLSIMDNAPMPNRTDYAKPEHPLVKRAHAVNEAPWRPISGHVKRRCEGCGFWFSSPGNRQVRCRDCEIEARKRRRRP